MGKILLVDDEPLSLFAVKKCIESVNIEVTTAGCGVEAWEILEKVGYCFDVIITDRIMPNMDGYELVRKIKESTFSYLPIIIITSSATPQEYQQAIDLGVFDFIYKPPNEKLTLAILEDAIRFKNNLLSKL